MKPLIALLTLLFLLSCAETLDPPEGCNCPQFPTPQCNPDTEELSYNTLVDESCQMLCSQPICVPKPPEPNCECAPTNETCPEGFFDTIDYEIYRNCNQKMCPIRECRECGCPVVADQLYCPPNTTWVFTLTGPQIRGCSNTCGGQACVTSDWFNVSRCPLIENLTDRDFCYANIAVETDNPALCEQIRPDNPYVDLKSRCIRFAQI